MNLRASIDDKPLLIVGFISGPRGAIAICVDKAGKTQEILVSKLRIEPEPLQSDITGDIIVSKKGKKSDERSKQT